MNESVFTTLNTQKQTAANNNRVGCSFVASGEFANVISKCMEVFANTSGESQQQPSRATFRWYLLKLMRSYKNE